LWSVLVKYLTRPLGPGDDLHQIRLGLDRRQMVLGAILDEGHELLDTPAVVVDPGFCWEYQALYAVGVMTSTRNRM
jgi:hypothetical protein